MHTETITFNPQNWVDDSVTAEIKGDTLTVRGETLTIKRQPTLRDPEDSKFDLQKIYVEWDGLKLAVLYKFGDETRWTAVHGDIERDHEDYMVLAGIIACNVI